MGMGGIRQGRAGNERGNESGNGQEREGIRGNENRIRVGMGAGMGRNERGNDSGNRVGMGVGMGRKESRNGSEKVGMGENESRDRNRAEGTGDTGAGHRTLEWDWGHQNGT